MAGLTANAMQLLNSTIHGARYSDTYGGSEVLVGKYTLSPVIHAETKEHLSVMYRSKPSVQELKADI